VWSLGVVLFQLLSGELPFTAKSEAEFSAQVLNQNALNLRAVAPGVTKELAQLVARCLHKDPWKRYANAAELYKAITTYTSQQRNKLRIPNAIASVRPKLRLNKPQQNTSPAKPVRRWTKRHIAAAGVAAGIALGHFMPHDVRDELSTATIGAFAAPIQFLSSSH
jgi:serine/threonine protein kinase